MFTTQDHDDNDNVDSFEPMSITVSHRLQNGEADFKIHDEDATLGEIIREQLLCDERVQFAGVRKHHPLDKHIMLKIKLYKEYSQKTNTSSIIISCLKNAAQKAIDICLQIQNTIPGIDSKYENNQGRETTADLDYDNIDPSQLCFN